MARDEGTPRLEPQEIRLSEMKERIRRQVDAGRRARESEGPEGGPAR